MKIDRIYIALIIFGIIFLAGIYLWNAMQQRNICVDFCLNELTRRQQEGEFAKTPSPIQDQMNYCEQACSKKTY